MNTPFISGLIAVIIAALLFLSWLLVSAVSRRSRITIPARLLFVVLCFDLFWFLTSFIYAAELDLQVKGSGITDELYTAMLTIHMWGYYISAILLTALILWYIIGRLATNAKRS